MRGPFRLQLSWRMMRLVSRRRRSMGMARGPRRRWRAHGGPRRRRSPMGRARIPRRGRRRMDRRWRRRPVGMLQGRRSRWRRRVRSPVPHDDDGACCGHRVESRGQQRAAQGQLLHGNAPFSCGPSADGDAPNLSRHGASVNGPAPSRAPSSSQRACRMAYSYLFVAPKGARNGTVHAASATERISAVAD